MKTLRTVTALAALALVASFGAQAQTKTDKATTTGEMSAPQKADEGVVKAAKPGPSTVERKDLKKEAAAARKAGASNDGECGPEQKADAGACKKPAAAKSDTTRAEVKQDAAAAKKAGATTTGEMSAPQKKDEGVKK
jgi:hypothetical protein